MSSDHQGHERRVLAAAFGDTPDAEVHPAALAGADRTRWLAAVALGGQGHYAAAATALRRLIGGRDQVLVALAGATLASHRRQLGGHAAARRLDSAALAVLARLGRPPVASTVCTTGCTSTAGTAGRCGSPTSGVDGRSGRGDPNGLDPNVASPSPATVAGDPNGIDLGGAWSDVLVGLAADAVGRGQLSQARRLHNAAEKLLAEGRAGTWRARVRTGWVLAEIELAAGQPERGRAAAEQAARLAKAVGARRHQVKSGLVLAGTFAAGGSPDGASQAHGLLEEVLSDSLRWGIFSLAWPAALMLSDLEPARGEHFAKIASNALNWSLVRSDASMQRMASASPWVPRALVRSGEPTRMGAG